MFVFPFSAVLDELLSGQPHEEAVAKIHDYLTDLRKKLDANEVAKGKFIITKGLTKDIKAYTDAKSQPHVQVALQMLAEV